MEVRYSHQLSDLAGIILPGGESTTMLHLLHLNRLWEPLKAFVRERPSWGACAGAILLARQVSHPVQESLGRLAVSVERNGYGRQIDSFIGPLTVTPPGRERLGTDQLEGVFIRAPRIVRRDAGVVVLAEQQGEAVMVEEGDCLASTFHPELSSAMPVHEYFLKRCQGKSR